MGVPGYGDLKIIVTNRNILAFYVKKKSSEYNKY
jgi:hypothetical protein